MQWKEPLIWHQFGAEMQEGGEVCVCVGGGIRMCCVCVHTPPFHLTPNSHYFGFLADSAPPFNTSLCLTNQVSSRTRYILILLTELMGISS